MKMAQLRNRLRPSRPMVTISMRVPEDVIADLKRVAPLLGFSGYQPLMRAYVGQGLRADLERLEPSGTVSSLLTVLRRHGVTDELLSAAVAEAQETNEGANPTVKRTRGARRHSPLTATR